MSQPIAAVILAGGKSTRMGTDKALLRIGSLTLLEHQIQLARSVLDEVWISGRVHGEKSFLDTQLNRGPLGGIHSAFEYLRWAQWLLIFPVDTPRLTSALLALLCNTAKVNVSRTAVHFGNQEMPVILRRDDPVEEFLTELLNTPNPSDRSVRNFLLRLDPLILPAPSENVFANLNTPSDWKNYHDTETCS